MKFHWFHTMPWPFLADDFNQQHRSVWVDIPYELFDTSLANVLYHEYLDELEFAEACGFDGIGVNEHHSNAHGLVPSPNLMAATLARNTTRASILILGTSIALYNPPIRVAEEYAMLDVLSGGRVIAGFPVGTPMDANFAYGVPPAELRDRYHEAHDLILQAWLDKGVSHFNGRFTQVRYLNPWPRPLQQPRPPIWIPGAGSVETWEWCVERGYLYAYLSTSGYLRARQIMDGFWTAVRAKQQEPNPFQVAIAQSIAVAETDAEARRLYERHVDFLYRQSLHVYPGFADPPGYKSARTLRAGLGGRRPRSDQDWESLTSSGAVIAGSPATVIEKLDELAETLRVGHIVAMMQLGSMDRELTNYNTLLFAEKVMPHLRGKFSEYPDHWSPRPLPQADRAVRGSLPPLERNEGGLPWASASSS
jgi:alkanesulfonate monooxygenase SsuD/methylene tetrahydromethanopterin reductase-like flavin-dependent oxidoreductase (luciferase family)